MQHESCSMTQIEPETYVDLDFVFDFSVDIDPVLLVGVDWSKVDVGNIVGLAIAVVARIAIIARVAIIARLF